MVWLALTITTLVGVASPPAPPELAVVVGPAGECRLAAVGSAAACPCRDLPAKIRLLQGLPLPLNRLSEEDLRAVSGIGPVRARAIVAERGRGGAFESTAALARVRGVGSITARRLGAFLFVGEADPACDSPVESVRHTPQ